MPRGAGSWRSGGNARDEVRTADPTEVITVARLERPLVLGRYRLECRLGAGAFGTVHLARDEQLDRMVAVKEIPCHDAEMASRAQREALAAARLNHPGVVALHEAQRDGDSVFLVSELVQGSTLAELCADGALTDRDIVRIGAALCDALEHAHARGVVHRDVKPANIIIPDEPSGEAGIAKLTDFGVASLSGDDGLTRTGDVVGTLAYMSPEQADGLSVDGRTDLYALALVLYEALSGSNPVRAGGAAATARRVGITLPSLAGVRGDLPADLAEAIDIAVDPDPQMRGGIADLRDALDEALDAADLSGGRPGYVEPMRPAEYDHAVRRLGGGGVARVLGALTTGAIVALVPSAATGITPPQGLVALCAGAVAALAVAVAPRVGWLFSIAGLAGWLIVLGAPGLAIVVLAAGIPAMVLLVWAGRLWPLPALAGVLALGGIAVAMTAIAGQAGTIWRRAVLGALGAWWVVLAETLARPVLLLGDGPDGTLPADWTASASTALSAVIGPALSSGAMIVAGVWAVGAAVLPILVRGRSLVLDLLAAACWSALLAVATVRATDALRWTGGVPEPRGLVLGSLACAGSAVVIATIRRRR